MTSILTRYESFKKADDELNNVSLHEKLATEYSDVCTSDEMTNIIERHIEEKNVKLLDTIGLDKQEQQLDSFLQQVRTRKKQLNMGVVKALKAEEVRLKKERKFMLEEIKAAKMNVMNNESGNAEQPRQVPTMDIQVAW